MRIGTAPKSHKPGVRLAIPVQVLPSTIMDMNQVGRRAVNDRRILNLSRKRYRAVRRGADQRVAIRVKRQKDLYVRGTNSAVAIGEVPR